MRLTTRQICQVPSRLAVGLMFKRLMPRLIPGACAIVLLGAALPVRADTVAGTIPGQFSVSPNGGANYSIPIGIPQGVHGMQPSLSLTYNSQGGVGLAGYRWDLSGLSSITRCINTYAEDGQVLPVGDNTSDDFCMDGQKLRPDGNGNYRAEIDDFSEIIPHTSGGAAPRTNDGSPQWFEVKTKDGLTYVYGATSDSQQWMYFPSPTNARANSCGTVLWTVINTWTLNQIRDRSGNAIDFHYAQDICTGAYWPTSITYTDRVSSGVPGVINTVGTQTVSFSYDDLTKLWPSPADLGEVFSGGNGVGHTQRLNGITVSYNGATTYSYSLNYQYDPATHYSELASVTACAGGHCFPATAVTWDTGAGQAGWASSRTGNSTTGTATQYAIAMDAFGDGTTQLVYPVYAGGSWYVGHITPNGMNIAPWPSGVAQGTDAGGAHVAMSIRYLGNGQDSILQAQYHAGLGATYWHVVTISPTGAFPNSQGTDVDTGVVTNGTDETNTIVADVNGDGLDDIVVAKSLPDGNAGLYVYLNSTAGFSTTPIILYDSGKAAGNNPPWLDTSVGGLRNGVRQADFDGDGRTDMLLKWGNGTTSSSLWWAMVSTGTKANPQLAYYAAITDADTSHEPLLLDANGDGLTDIVYVCAPAATTCTPGDWVMDISTGWGFAETDTGKKAQYPDSAIITDFNGDGHQDIMYPTSASGDWYVYRSEYYPVTSTNPIAYYGLSATMDTGVAVATFPDPMVSNEPVVSIDLDGDGTPDLLGTDPSSGDFEFAVHENTPLRVSSITDGLGNQVQWSYASIANGNGVYSPAAGNLNYPTAPAVMSLYVVNSYQASSGANNGDASSYTVSYSYQGAAGDALGRGFLGFASMQQVDSRLGTTTVSTYDQTFPYIGKLLEQTVTTSGTLQADIRNSYANIVTSGSAASYTDADFPYVATSTVYSYGAGGHDAMNGQLVKTVKTTSTFDNFGNATLVTTDTNPGATGHFEQNLIYIYNEDTTDWCVGLPASVTIAKSYGYANTTPGTDNGRYGNQARETTYGNDYVNCRVNSKTAVAAEPGLSLTTTNSYTDIWGNVNETQVTDGNNNVLRDTLYDYSSTSGAFPGNITENNATSGVNLQTTETWDQARGLMLSSEDVNNALTTSFTYDSFGRKSSETEPDQTSTQYAYTACPGNGCIAGAAYRLDTTHYASDGTTPSDTSRGQYDSFNRVIETSRYVLNDQKAYQDTQYDSLGRKVGVTAPYMANAAQYWTTTVYDSLSRPKTITQPADQNTPAGTTTNIEYDTDSSGAAVPYAVARTVTSTVPDGVSTQTAAKVFDSQGVLVESEDAENNIVYNTDAFGGVITVTDTSKVTGVSNVTNINYDSMGHKINMTDPDTGRWTYQTDALGEVIGETDANGNTIAQQYDNLGRLISRTDTDVHRNVTASSWTYDTAANGVGRLAMETKGDFTKSYSYDGYGRPSSTDTNIAGVDYVSSETYDKFGRVASVTYPATPVPPADTAPVASAGAAQTVAVNTAVTLDGSASTESGSAPMPLTYTWSQTAGPMNVGIDGSRAPKTTFTPAQAGSYSFQLMVGDGQDTNTGTTSVAVLPGVPGGITFSPSGTNNSGSYTVNWGAAAGSAASYTLFESTDGVNFTALPTSYTGTSAPLTGKGSGAQAMTYTYKVEACVNSGSLCGPLGSTASISVKLLPAAPTRITNNGDPAHSGSYTVSWTAPAALPGFSAFTYYVMEATGNSSGPTSGYTLKNGCTGTATTCTLSHPGNSSYYYYYYVYASDPNGNGPDSGVTGIQVVVRPGVPGAFSPASQTVYTSSAGLAWGAASGLVVAYQVFESPTTNFSTEYYQGGNGNASITVALSGYGTTYYRVRACNENGSTTVCSDWQSYATVVYKAVGGGGGGGGGCPPQPEQCQLVLPDDQLAANKVGASSGQAIGSGVTPDMMQVSAPESPITAQIMATLALVDMPVRQLMLPAPSVDSTDAVITKRAVRAAPVERRLAALRADLAELPPSIIGPSAQPGWQQRWQSLEATSGSAQASAQEQLAATGDTQPRGAAGALERVRRAGVYSTGDVAGTSLHARLAAQDQATGDDYGVQGVSAPGTEGLTVNYVYDDHDNLEAVVDAQDLTLVYWQAQTTDNWGNDTGVIYGNNVVTARVYDAATGSLLGISSGLGSSPSVQNEQYQWDGLGNLAQRQDVNAGLTESFQYDDLNRLSNAAVSGSSVIVPSLSMSYDAFGNILTKSDTGTYAYDPAHAHRLQSVTPAVAAAVSYQFDSNGNLQSSSDGRSVTWTVDNKPSSITSNSNTSTFAYDPENQRYREYNQVNGANGATTLEIGALMEVVTPDGGNPTYRLMIKAGGETVAVKTVQASGSFAVNYLHYDHLGSVDAITDVSGNVTQRFSYDAFGRRRDTSTWAPLASGGSYTGITDRGYTGQQELDSLGLIHMNGRVYDPALGRFMSADPNIQSLYYSQSLNRYAYVDNNPLRYTDPSGYCTAGSDLAGIMSGGILGGGCGRNAMKTLVVDAWHFINHPAKVLEYSAPGLGNFINVRMSHSQSLQRIGGDVALVASMVVSCILTPAAGAGIYATYEAYITDINGGSGLQIAEVGAISYMKAYEEDTSVANDWSTVSGMFTGGGAGAGAGGFSMSFSGVAKDISNVYNFAGNVINAGIKVFSNEYVQAYLEDEAEDYLQNRAVGTVEHYVEHRVESYVQKRVMDYILGKLDISESQYALIQKFQPLKSWLAEEGLPALPGI